MYRDVYGVKNIFIIFIWQLNYEADITIKKNDEVVQNCSENVLSGNSRID